MPRARDPSRDKAFEIYKKHKGRIDLAEIASQLNIPSGTVRGWKSKDSWEDKLNGTFQKNMERSKRKKQTKKEAVADEVNQVIENTELTDKQRLFCLYYVRCFNATKAYKKAYGSSYDVANAEGYKLLVNPCIKEEIQKLKQNRLNREYLSEEDIFQKYIDIAFSDITDYVSFGREAVPVMGTFGPVQVKDEETGEKKTLMKEVNTVKFRESGTVDGSLISEVKQGKDGASIKLLDKMKALQWLTDHMDLASEEQKARIAVLRAKSQTGDDTEIADDGFLDALNGTAAEDWSDEED